MSRQGADKRNKERARQQKQHDKASDRAERKRQKDSKGDLPPGVDPDIAGIIPGPQPREDDEGGRAAEPAGTTQ